MFHNQVLNKWMGKFDVPVESVNTGIHFFIDNSLSEGKVIQAHTKEGFSK